MTNPLTQSDLLDTLRRIVGEANVITDAAEVAAASLDGRGRRQGAALAVVRPGSTEETAAVMKTAARAGFTVIAQGGNTSNVGGATPEPGASADEAAHTLILQTGRMRRILAVDPVNNTVTVEAGAVLQTVQEAAAAHHRLFPLSLAAEGSCQIGGVIATNAGGVHVLRYGSARRMVLGLKVVLASGDVLNLMRGLRKDNAGYALKELFIGSEGTLGILRAHSDRDSRHSNSSAARLLNPFAKQQSSNRPFRRRTGRFFLTSPNGVKQKHATALRRLKMP